MNDFFILLLLGHIIGDYVYQPLWMALRKKSEISIAISHCLWYTLAVFLCTFIYFDFHKILVIPWTLFVFFSHLVLDATNIIDRILHITGGRSYKNAEDYVLNNVGVNKQLDILCQYMIAYTAIVQTVLDNAFHIFSMYFFYKILIWIN